MPIDPNIQNRLTGVASRARVISGGGTSQRRNNVTGILGRQRGGSPPSVPPVNGARGGRQGRRLLSQPDSRMVEEARQEERARGGPPAPRNSLDLSVVTLDETVVLNEDDNNIYRSVFDGVSPINPNSSQRAATESQDNDIEVAFIDTTIDLTDSPPRIFPIPPLSFEATPRPSRSLPAHDPTDSPPRIFPVRRFTRPSMAQQDLLTTDSPSRIFPPLPSSMPSEAPQRPSQRLPRDLTDSLPRVFPSPRYSRPSGAPHDVLTRPLTPQRPRSRTFLRPRSDRIGLADNPPRSPRFVSPQPSSPRFLSPYLTNNGGSSSNLSQSVSPPASLKCPVCMEPFQSIRRRGANLVSTVCGHVFCGKCLPACVRISGHCPSCRKKIGYEDFHPLYLF